MTGTSYLRSDALPGRTAVGYLGAEGDRNNVLHLPVRGSGDGGAYTTVADVHRLWAALRAGVLLRPRDLAEAWRPRSDVPIEGARYGAGFWRERSLRGCEPRLSLLDPGSLRRSASTATFPRPARAT